MGSGLAPLLLLCLLFIGMAIGFPISLSDRFMAMAPGCGPDLPFFGPSEMYSAHWNWHTTYGSMLGRNPRPSVIDSDSFPFGGPTAGDFSSFGFGFGLGFGAKEVDDKPEGGSLLSCERVRGVCGGVA
jgi:hypothetical protein